MTLEEKIAARLERTFRKTLSPADVLTALQAMNQNQRQILMNAIRANDATSAGVSFMGAVNSQARAKALARANDMLANNTLSRTELEEVLDE